MSFGISQRTLEQLEWPQILGRLAELARTPRGRARFAVERGEAGLVFPDLFETALASVRERLEETSEARAILRSGDRPPLGGVTALERALSRARKGGMLSPEELLALRGTLGALRATSRFLALRKELAPRLADLASTIVEHPELESDIDRCLEPSGELRDAASSTLAAARRETRRLSAALQQRIERYLQNPETTAHLSDRYYTVRNDRFVLPVRADARGGVRGIVHDASGSGTTLFVEPEALVELNNRLKGAELEVEREVRRVLRELSERAASVADDVESGLLALEIIDCAFARAELAEEQDATRPAVETEGVVVLPQLRHPALPPEEAVPNDVRLGESFHVLVISGPNAGGKTVTMKAVALAALCARAGLHVPAGEGARVDLFDAILADIGDEQDIRESLSTFSAHMTNVARIVRRASANTLVVLDEIGVGTDPGEGAAIAQAALETLADAGARVIATTHYNLLKEMADVDPRFENASVEFDPETLAPTYRLRLGVPGASSATAVAARMGLSGGVLERANQLLEREDRTLDRMLADLAASRAALESEQREAARLRAETETARDEYRHRLERLQERRDKLYAAMRDDLDRAFREAHGQIAAVIRDLQRGGSARDAARARERLQTLATETREAEAQAGVEPGIDETASPIDWRFARPGDTVSVRGGGDAVLLALPDRRGRVTVQLGSARVQLPAERVSAAKGEARRPQVPRAAIRFDSGAARAHEDEPSGSDGDGRCHLRGMRVAEALDVLEEAIDRALSAGRPRLVVVHGIGTGTLRRAVRQYLADSPYVAGYENAGRDEGGDGATIAILR